MYILLGKKNVRVFEVEKQRSFSLSYEKFYKNYYTADCYKFIVDRADIDFSLEYLKNCSIIDAYQ